jgi:hypothetical protein
MALVSIGESRWRMLRRVLRKKKFKFDDARNMTRLDRQHFDWLLTNGFMSKVAEDAYELTDRGRASADMGEYDWEPTAATVAPPAAATVAPPKKSKKAK